MAEKTKNLKAIISLQDQLSKPLKQVKASLKGFQKSTEKLGSSLKSLGSLTFGPLLAGLGSLGAIVKSSVNALADYSSSVKDTAIRTNTATDALQRLRYAAEQSGSSAGQLDSAMTIFSKNLANGIAGKNKDLIKTFETLGISLKNANGQYKTTAELMPEIADAMKRQTSAQQKAYIATQMFGRSGQSLIQMLEQGSDALNQLGDDAERFGVVVDHDSIIAAADFNDALGRLNISTQGLKNTIGAQLIPILRPLVDGMSEWVAENRQWIATAIGDAVRDFVAQIKKIDFKAIIKGAIDFTKRCVEIFNALGGLKTIGIAIASIFGLKLVSSFMSTVSAVISVAKSLGTVTTALKALTIAFATNPIGLAITAIIAAVAGLAYAIYTNWDEIKAYLIKCWDSIVKRLQEAWNSITTIWDSFCELPKAIMNGDWSKVGEIFGDIYKSISNLFFTPFKIAFDLIANAMPESWKKKFGELADWFGELWKKIKELFFAPFEKASQMISDVAQSVKDLGKKAWNKLKFWESDDETEQNNIEKPSLRDAEREYLDSVDLTKPLKPVDPYTPNMDGTLNVKVETEDGTKATVDADIPANSNLDLALPNGQVR